jgi:hypothetical protein
LILTDNRLVFNSQSKPATIPYRMIIGWSGASNQISIRIANKPELRFFFPPSQSLVADKFDALVRLHSQQKTRVIDGAPDQHIPREVRQRVWQRYAGKCAECMATDYLEFDHIVPLAKGGNNSEQNVQLICRRCNLKKSDKI